MHAKYEVFKKNVHGGKGVEQSPTAFLNLRAQFYRDHTAPVASAAAETFDVYLGLMEEQNIWISLHYAEIILKHAKYV